MTRVFIGGSRRISSLNAYVRAELDGIIHNGYTILVGDANGADKSVQKYLLDMHYINVIVFCMANGCRNNLGQWETKGVEVSGNRKGFEFYSAKDLEMVKEADYGFMLWDTKSKGTLLNIIRLLKSDKKTIVYVSPERTFLTLITQADIGDLLAKCDAEHRDLFENKFKISRMLKREPIQHALDLAC
jgi:adenine-specific DNA-methyltransferase